MRAYLSLLGAGTVLYRRAILTERLSGPELTALRAARLLRPAASASTWPCERRGSCQREVCASPRGAARTPFYGVCEDPSAADPCAAVDLTADDVAQESVAVADFVALLRELYRVETSARLPREVGPEPLLLGEERTSDGVRDVFLALEGGATLTLAPFLAVRERVERPTLVLVPTAHALSPALAARHAPGGHVEVERLDDALAVRGDKIVRAGKLRLVAKPRLEIAEPVAKGKKKPAAQPAGRIAEEIGSSAWEGIKITVVDGHTVRIQHGKVTLRRNYLDLGLGSSGRRDPTEKWKLLLLICAGHGSFRWKDLGTYKAAKNAVYVLRMALKSAFGLAEDPFHRFHAVNGWRAKFFAGSEIAEED